MNLIEQCQQWNEQDEFQKIIDAIEAIPADLGGKLVEINAKQGDKVRKGDVIAYIQRDNAQ